MRMLNGFKILGLVLAATATACSPSMSADGDGAAAKSLTLNGATGSKFYFGFGQYIQNEEMMYNETKYDVKHTHDIFASGAGGDYKSTTLVDKQFGTEDVLSGMRKIADQTQADDMYVQYSSGHGYNGGLEIGGDYSSLLDTALGMKAKEVVIFTMACFSGSEVDELNRRKADWQNWAAQGRTLFVMSSSTASEESSTGPGTDDKENGPNGSAGSAYGHSLWKSLTGEADGAIDGIKDGFISLGEIAAYATKKTEQIGGHTPTVGGVYNPNLIMNKVPGASYVAQQVREGGTGAMSDAQVRTVTDASDAIIAQWKAP